VLGETVVSDLALTHGRDPADPLIVHLGAAEDGDVAAQRMVDEMARRLTLIAGSMALVLDPEAFVLAGYAAHPTFVAAVQRTADEFAPLLPLRFLVSEFGREATIIGAIGEATGALRESLFTRILSPADQSTR
jgi:predicted NBD/HSP70 family sugar kinase